jgi:hypothetical protein
MKHTVVLAMKFISNVIIFTIALDLFFEASIADILSFSVLLTIVSYFIGDRILLSRVGNVNATIADFFLAYLIVWIFGNILLHSYLQVAWGSIITAILVAFSEVFVHRYILSQSKTMDQDQSKSIFNGKLAYGMEIGEEYNPSEKDKE